MKKIAALTTLALALPAVAFAQTGGNLTPIQNLLTSIGRLVANAIPILIGIALLVFIWGIIGYIRKPEAAEGRKIMIAGVVGLFVIVSIWGIIILAQNALLGSGAVQTVPAPRIPGQ